MCSACCMVEDELRSTPWRTLKLGDLFLEQRDLIAEADMALAIGLAVDKRAVSQQQTSATPRRQAG
jgi:hypothetical protein